MMTTSRLKFIHQRARARDGEIGLHRTASRENKGTPVNLNVEAVLK